MGRTKRKSWTKKDPDEETDTQKDVNHVISDMRFDWKGFKIPKSPCTFQDEYPNIYKDQRDDFENRSTKKTTLQSPFQKKQTNKIKHKTELQTVDWLPSRRRNQPDDFEISKRDEVEIRRKLFEENYWKSQLQKRHAQSQSCYQQTHLKHSTDPRLQKMETAAIPNRSDSVQELPHNVSHDSTGSQVPGTARRELFAGESVKQRREREYEERLRREFEKRKKERTLPIQPTLLLLK